MALMSLFKIVLFVFFILFSLTTTFAAPLLQWPLKNPVLLQGFGITEFVKQNPNFYESGEHLGIDVSEGFEAPIYAAADGVVVTKGKEVCPNFSHPRCNYGKGNWILLWHDTLGLATHYQHLSRPSHLPIGARVRTTDTIGFEGASGRIVGDGSHLHFSVYKDITIYTTLDGNTEFQIMARESILNPIHLLPPITK